MSVLVDAGADVNARNAAGDSPLHAAWKHDHPEVIDRLLALGADARALNNAGRVPGPVCDWSDYSFFRVATVESVRGCIAAGTPVDSRNEFGDTPLERLGSNFRG